MSDRKHCGTTRFPYEERCCQCGHDCDEPSIEELRRRWTVLAGLMAEALRRGETDVAFKLVTWALSGMPGQSIEVFPPSIYLGQDDAIWLKKNHFAEIPVEVCPNARAHLHYVFVGTSANG